MNTKLLWVLLFLASGSWGRDPFFPLNALRCEAALEAEFAWRLLGLIGREDRYDAWLVSPQHKILRRQPGDLLPGTVWRIAEIDAQAVTITTLQDCQPPRRLALTGRNNDQDDLSVAGADKPVVSQPGSPLTRF